MTMRRAAVAAVLAALGIACQRHPEKSVVDQYFNAVRAGDTQTLASFAAVSFDQKVERWEIKSTGDEQKSDAPLPTLVQKVKDLEAELAANTRAARAYNNETWQQLDQVKALKAGAAVPAALAPVKAKWDEFNQKDRDLKKAVANAKEAVEKEKRSVVRSVGQVDEIETLKGEMKEKKIDLDLTLAGQVKPYVMTVRKYEMKREGGPRVQSRWVVQTLTPR